MEEGSRSGSMEGGLRCWYDTKLAWSRLVCMAPVPPRRRRRRRAVFVRRHAEWMQMYEVERGVGQLVMMVMVVVGENRRVGYLAVPWITKYGMDTGYRIQDTEYSVIMKGGDQVSDGLEANWQQRSWLVPWCRCMVDGVWCGVVLWCSVMVE